MKATVKRIVERILISFAWTLLLALSSAVVFVSVVSLLAKVGPFWFFGIAIFLMFWAALYFQLAQAEEADQ